MPAKQHTQNQQSLGQIKLGTGGNGKRPLGSRLVLPDPVPGSQSWYLLTAVRKLLQPMPGQCPASCTSSRNGLKWHKIFRSRLFPWSIWEPGYGRELLHSAGGKDALWSRQGGAGGHARPRLSAHTSREPRLLCLAQRAGCCRMPWDPCHVLQWKQKSSSSLQTAARVFVNHCVHSR